MSVVRSERWEICAQAKDAGGKGAMPMNDGRRPQKVEKWSAGDGQLWPAIPHWSNKLSLLINVHYCPVTWRFLSSYFVFRLAGEVDEVPVIFFLSLFYFNNYGIINFIPFGKNTTLQNNHKFNNFTHQDLTLCALMMCVLIKVRIWPLNHISDARFL